MRPPKTEGCPQAAFTPGNPNAHLSLIFGTSAALSPEPNLVLAASAPQPFHEGPVSLSRALPVQRLGIALASANAAMLSLPPERNSAMDRFAPSFSAADCARIEPVLIDL